MVLEAEMFEIGQLYLILFCDKAGSLNEDYKALLYPSEFWVYKHVLPRPAPNS